MLDSGAEARTFLLRDLPLVQRLKSQGISLDSESYLVRGLHTIEDAALSRLPLVDLGAPTLVVRYNGTPIIGQMRHSAGDTHAHIVFVSPTLTNGYDDTLEAAWFHLLDALAAVAGQRGAHTIHAEVNENSIVFETLCQAGYASYAQQDIWRRDPAPPPDTSQIVVPRQATADDLPAIRRLHDRLVPALAQQADPLPAPDGLIQMQDGRAAGYLAVRTGSRGIFLRPYLPPDDPALARGMVIAALAMLPGAAKTPVYCCVRGYQRWLGGLLEALGFKPWARQTVMVRHTVARIERPAFAPLPAAVQGGISVSGGHGGRH